MEDTTPAGKPIVDREKVRSLTLVMRARHTHILVQTAPFLIRTFVKIGAYHRLAQFEDGPLPLADEQPVYTWCVLDTTRVPLSPSVSSATSDTMLQERRHAP